MVVQRPNHGYDFGAYRDGLRLLDRSGHTPETLILMNDSTWFPLHAEDRSLAELDRADAPFSGLSYKYEPPIRRGRSHMESHFLRFSATTLKSPAFREFWSAYIPSNSRVTTIERGEKGLTSAIEAAGLPAVSILSRERLLYALAGVPPARLEELLWSADITAVPDRERLADHLADFHDDVGWASDAVRLMEDLTDRFSTVLSAELVALTAVCLGLPFLKKSRESRFARARRMYLDLVADGRVPPADPQILEEIRRAAAQDAATDPTKPV